MPAADVAEAAPEDAEDAADEPPADADDAAEEAPEDAFDAADEAPENALLATLLPLELKLLAAELIPLLADDMWLLAALEALA